MVAILRIVIVLGKLLPWTWRTHIGGRLIGSISALVPEARKRIYKSTSVVYPDWSDKQRLQFARLNLRHFGQNMIELFNIQRFSQELPYFEIEGAGWDILRTQKEAGQGAIAISGHFGQWEAIRIYMKSQGMPMAGLYKENSNPCYEKLFLEASEVSGPMFHTGVRGMSSLVKILRNGGFISLLHDQRISKTPHIPFMGHMTNTSTATAEMALKYDVPLIPIYAIRQDDMRHYKIIAEEPIPHSDATTMTRAMNESLGTMVAAHPTQWLWLHDRWKLRREK